MYGLGSGVMFAARAEVLGAHGRSSYDVVKMSLKHSSSTKGSTSPVSSSRMGPASNGTLSTRSEP